MNFIRRKRWLASVQGAVDSTLRRVASKPGFEALEERHLLSGMPIGGETLVAPFDQAASYAQSVSPSTDQAVAVHDDGSFAIAYTNHGEPELGDEVYVRRFNADRTPTAENDLLRVDTDGLGDQNSAAVTTLPNGGLLVAWYDRGCSVDLDVDCLATFDVSDALYARRFNAQGEPVDDEPWRANVDAISAQAQPTVAADADGNFAVAWTGSGSDSTGGVWLRQFDAAGIATDAEDQRLFTGGAFTESPSSAMDGAGNLALAWSVEDRIGLGSGSEVLGQYRPAEGAEPVALQIHGDSPGEHLWPSLDMDAAGNFIVAFTQAEVAEQDGQARDVFVRRFSTGGDAVGDAPLRVNTSFDGDQEYGRVAMAADGSFLVVWNGSGAQPGDADDNGVFAQEFDNSGVPVEGQFLVNSTLAGGQMFPSVDMSPEGAAIVVWCGVGDQVDATPDAGDQSDPAGVFLQAIQIEAPVGEVDVRGNGTSILNGDMEPSDADGTLLGEAAANEGSISREFVIHNVGFGNLTLLDDQAIAVHGGEEGEFTIEYDTTDTIPAQGMLAFTVSFAPAAIGLRTATVSIQTDDADESPIEFAVGGIGLAPIRPWRNPSNPYDVNGDGVVSGLDALILINHLNKHGPHGLPPPKEGSTPPPFYDVNGDNKISALDALQTINALNARRPPVAGRPPARGNLPRVATRSPVEEKPSGKSDSRAPARRTTESTDAVFGSWAETTRDRENTTRGARRRLG